MPRRCYAPTSPPVAPRPFGAPASPPTVALVGTTPDVTVTVNRASSIGTSRLDLAVTPAQRAFGHSGPGISGLGQTITNDGDSVAAPRARQLVASAATFACQFMHYFGAGNPWPNPVAGAPTPDSDFYSAMGKTSWPWPSAGGHSTTYTSPGDVASGTGQNQWATFDRRHELALDQGLQPIGILCGCPWWLASMTHAQIAAGTYAAGAPVPPAGKTSTDTTPSNQWLRSADPADASVDYSMPPYNGPIVLPGALGPAVPGYAAGTAGTAIYADLALRCAKRYPRIRRWVVWSELRGYQAVTGSATKSDWIDAYLPLYNQVWTTLKGYDPTLQVGGPYLTLDPPVGGWSVGGANALQGYDQTALQHFMSQALGCDFLAYDGASIWSTYNGQAPQSDPAYVLSVASQSQRTVQNVRTLMTTQGTNGFGLNWAATNPDGSYVVPIHVMESYIDTNLGNLAWYPANYATHEWQACAMALRLKGHLLGGAGLHSRWAPTSVKEEGFADGSYAGLGNQQALVSDPSPQTGRSYGGVPPFGDVGGQPFPALEVYRAYHQSFAPGTPLYAVTSSSASVEAVANAQQTLLINMSNGALTISVNGARFRLDPYSARLVQA